MAGEVTSIEFRLLGPLEAVAGGQVVAIGSLQQRAILVALLLARNSVVSTDQLVDVVWGDEPPASAASTLRGLVWRLRKRLGVTDIEGRDDGYRLVAGDDAVDSRRFDSLVAQGRQAAQRNDGEAAAAAFTAALDLWRGPALGELASWAFAQPEAVRLDEARLEAVENLAEAELSLGRAASALSRLEPLVHQFPLRERAVGQLMVALYRTGRQADALAAYQSLRRTLADDLGLVPTPGLRDLEAAILRQSEELLVPTPAPPPAPPPRSPPSEPVRDNLPAALTRFVGRARELAEIQEELAVNRLVTLVGPGGAGKTRLALEVARLVQTSFPDGAWFVDLAQVNDESLVAQKTAAGVGLLVGELAQSGQGLDAALAERLRSRRILIVLDNCEQVIAGAARVAHALLVSCPELTMLATSREALAVPGEVAFTVPSLQASDAVALFCARAHDADRHFSMSDANADAVRRICHRLDGLPLALEIAAARARVLGTKELAERLDDRFAALGEGSRTAPARHQTLRAAIDWSHDLLSPTEQSALHQLSVFPGTFNLEAVRAVLGADAVLPFTRLVDKSLVAVTAQEPGARYHLSESVRAYAADKLAVAGGTAAAQRRHRDAFLSIAPTWLAENEDWLRAESFRMLDTDYANFIAALEWSWASDDADAAMLLSGALLPYWYWSGHPEACEWMERTASVGVSCSAMIGPVVVARAGLAWLLRNFGEDADGRAQSLMADAIAVADMGDDPFPRALARLLAADVLIVTGQLDKARLHLQWAREAFRSLNSASAFQLACERMWAWTLLSAGDLDGAAQALEQLERLAIGGDSLHVPHSLAFAALVRARQGDPSAGRLAAEAVDSARKFLVPQILVMTLARAAEVAVLSERLADARPHVVELVKTLKQLGARRWVAEALELAAIVFGEEQPDMGATALGAAERLRLALAEPAGPAFLLGEALDTAVRGISDRLGTETFALEKARGASLPVDEALALVATRLGGG